jgi:hypothetical protein
VSIVRIGLAEGKKFGAGYDAIFGKKKGAKMPAAAAKKPVAKKAKKK